MRTHMDVCTYVRMHACMHVCVKSRMHRCIFTCMYVLLLVREGAKRGLNMQDNRRCLASTFLCRLKRWVSTIRRGFKNANKNRWVSNPRDFCTEREREIAVHILNDDYDKQVCHKVVCEARLEVRSDHWLVNNRPDDQK